MTDQADSETGPAYRGSGAAMLNEMHDCLVFALQAHPDVSGGLAAKLARQAVDTLRTEFGGSLVYFPKGTNHEVRARNDQIVAEFNGRNHKELARKYGLTLQRVYKLLESRARRQDQRG